MLTYDRSTKMHLTPGTYVAPSPFSSDEIRNINPTSEVNITSIHIGVSLVVAPPPQPLLFSKDMFNGEVVRNQTAWSSAYFPQGYYGLLEPGRAIWDAVPDRDQLTGGSKSLLGVGLCESCESVVAPTD